MLPFFYKYLSFSIIFILSFISLNTYPATEKELHFESDIWCPYTCDEKITHKKGYVIDIAEEIFAKNNIKFTYKIIPWARVLLRSEKGEIDAMGAAYKEGREDKYIFPTEDFGKSINKFYVMKNNHWIYHAPESLKTITLGTIIGYVYGGEILTIQKYSKKVMATGGENPFERNIERLKRGEIDATIDESNVATYTLRQMKLIDKIKEAGNIGKKTGIYIGFPKVLPNSEKYAKMLSNGIIEMKKTGRFQKILKNYNLKMD